MTATSRADRANRTASLLRLVQRRVERSGLGRRTELRFPLAQQHLAQLGEAVALGRPRPLERGALALRGHLVGGQVEAVAWSRLIFGQRR